MATGTTNFSLTKDASTDYYNIDTANDNLDKIDKALGNTAKFETAGGTGTDIILTGIEFEEGHSKTFVVNANNNGVATTINGKNLYKPGTTQAPKLIAGKAVTVWYNGTCFFIKASAEGNAVAENVLAGKTFSNDDDTGIAGTMLDNGPVAAETVNLSIEGAEYTIPKGFHSGLRKIRAKISGLVASVIKSGTTVGGILGTFTSDATATAGDVLSNKTAYIKGDKVTGSIPSQGAQTITPGTANKTIASGQYLSGAQTIAGDTDLVSANIKAGANIFGVSGNSNVVDTSAGDAIAGNILSGKKAYVDGALVTGTMSNYDNSVSGAQMTTNISSLEEAVDAGGAFGVIDIKSPFNGKVNTSSIIKQNVYGLNSSVVKAGQKIGAISGSLVGTFTSDANAVAGNILNGKTAYVNGAKVTGNIPSQGAQTITPGTANKTIARGRYLSGTQTIKGDANLISANILNGKSIFGVAGTAKRVLSGSIPSSTFVSGVFEDLQGVVYNNESVVTVSYPFGFLPKTIVITKATNLSSEYASYQTTTYSERADSRYAKTAMIINSDKSGSYSYIAYKADVGALYVTENGFRLPVLGLTNSAPYFEWVAIE